jgi:hypothetical protein
MREFKKEFISKFSEYFWYTLCYCLCPLFVKRISYESKIITILLFALRASAPANHRPCLINPLKFLSFNFSVNCPGFFIPPALQRLSLAEPPHRHDPLIKFPTGRSIPSTWEWSVCAHCAHCANTIFKSTGNYSDAIKH